METPCISLFGPPKRRKQPELLGEIPTQNHFYEIPSLHKPMYILSCKIGDFMDNIDYEKLDFKIPIESSDYLDCSDFVVMQIESVVKDAIGSGKNKM
jgi:hypothetical protein